MATKKTINSFIYASVYQKMIVKPKFVNQLIEPKKETANK